MNIVNIIDKKRVGKDLTREELEHAFCGYLKKEIEDYQMSSLLMAICINGINDEEIINLTEIFINSGKTIDLSSIPGIKVDKHSTGGIGDKTTFVICPIVASCGVNILKMSGRGLGITGGTLDKLESIRGLNINLNKEEYMTELNDIGMAIISQTEDLVPLDKEIYALRDVTGTVSSVGLIAVSVMSKKIASGADKILIDLKLGKGALIKTQEEANELANIITKIGEKFNKETRVLITNMDNPLGKNIGNGLEVLEAIDTLKGDINNKFGRLCIELASNLVSMGKNITVGEAEILVIDSITSGNAYNKFLEFIKYQGGDIENIKLSNKKIEVESKKSGVLEDINAEIIGNISMDLGAGRQDKKDIIDHGVGIVINKEVGEKIELGETLCTLFVGEKVVDEEKVYKAFTVE